MNKRALILLAAVAVLAGCSKVEPPQPVAKAPSPGPALPALSQDKSAAEPPPAAPDAVPAAAIVTSAAPAAESADASAPKRLTDHDVDMLNYAVYKYKEQFGHFPKTLQDMVGTPHLVRVPITPPDQKLVYDAGSGSVKVTHP